MKKALIVLLVITAVLLFAFYNWFYWGHNLRISGLISCIIFSFPIRFYLYAKEYSKVLLIIFAFYIIYGSLILFPSINYFVIEYLII